MAILPSELQSCIDACNRSLTLINACLNQHMGEPDMAECHRLCLDARDIISACVGMMARESRYHQGVCGLCADICEACADECAKFDSEVCQQCAEACRECARQCRIMVA
jgi:hypothetical protein